jgi:hypothetical protein
MVEGASASAKSLGSLLIKERVSPRPSPRAASGLMI